ncbi:hypothetical protein M3649_04045 [Ureibacillus chungkukjangi]|uniref:hypothetical protein n=1 Tax=Ureibacillus chungkukjangi TaxID=1202712 RepID=UPI0020414C9F|nr:hypothetical protein [Ureibacillus chungkukjangi]MCM3387304.1 hypothetical protein [Ureibacillus chungkukjangi]
MKLLNEMLLAAKQEYELKPSEELLLRIESIEEQIAGYESDLKDYQEYEIDYYKRLLSI